MLGGFQTMKRVYIELQRNFATPPPDDCEDCEYIFPPNIIGVFFNELKFVQSLVNGIIADVVAKVIFDSILGIA